MKKIYLIIASIIAGSSYSQTTSTSLGDEAGSAANSTHIGYSSGKVSTADSNVFVGSNGGVNNTTGRFNVFSGANSGFNNTTGSNNTFLGHGSGYTGVTGNQNTYVGSLSGKDATGSYNNFFGANAGYGVTGNHNVFMGMSSGRNTSGTGNVFIGNYSGEKNTSGSNNIFTGYFTGYDTTTGAHNIFTGQNSGRHNKTGSANIYMGYATGFKNETGSYNVYQGYAAGREGNGGSYNVLTGLYSGYVTTGDKNTFLGTNTGRYNTTGSENIFLGSHSGYANITGIRNTYLGAQSGYQSTGNNNVFIGFQAGYKEVGSDKLYIDNTNTVSPLIYGDFAANILNFNGKVGIGTNTPSVKLDVVKGKMNIRPANNNETGIFRINEYRGGGLLDFSEVGDAGVLKVGYYGLTGDRVEINGGTSGTGGELAAYDDGNIKVKLSSRSTSFFNGGKVGIGTSSPSHTFEVNTGSGSFKSYNTGVEYTVNTSGGWARSFRFRNENDDSTVAIGGHNGDAYISTNFDINTDATGYRSQKMIIKKNGNIAIGTTDPKGYKLAVAGDAGIVAEKVTVKIKANWPDYVFESNYKLPTLLEVENHIKAKGHLKDIPSAKDVVKNGGIELGDMNRKLLQKIEELTLYTIQQEKKIKELEKDKERLNKLEEKINLLLKNK